MIEEGRKADIGAPVRERLIEYGRADPIVPYFGLFWFSFTVAVVTGLIGAVGFFRDLLRIRQIDKGDIIVLGCAAAIVQAALLCTLRALSRSRLLRSAVEG